MPHNESSHNKPAVDEGDTVKYCDTNTSSKCCPSCRNPHLAIAIVDLNDEILICQECGWQEGDEDPSDQDQGVLWIEEVKHAKQ